MSNSNKNKSGSSVDIPLKVGNDDSGIFFMLTFLEISKIGNPKVSVSVAAFPSSFVILLMDGSETGFSVSPKCSADSRSAYPNTDSSILGCPSGASLAPLEFSVGGIFLAPVSVGLVGGFVFESLELTNLPLLSLYLCIKWKFNSLTELKS
jgi:hypothetical protein